MADAGLGAAAASLGLGALEILGPEATRARDPRHGAVAELLRSRKPERVRDGIHALDLAADPVRFAAGRRNTDGWSIESDGVDARNVRGAFADGRSRSTVTR